MKQIKAIEVSGITVKMVKRFDNKYQVLVASKLIHSENAPNDSFEAVSSQFDEMVIIHTIGN